MFRQMVVLSIVCVCALTIVSAGQERVPVETDLQHRFDRNRDGFIGTEEQIERLYTMAVDAKAAGQYDRADAIYHEAKEMEQRLKNIAEPKKGVGQENRLERQVEQLRDQVNGLRKEIEELKEIVSNRATGR